MVMDMRIFVCVKQVLDPEIPPRSFRIDEATGKAGVVGMPAALVMDSYAENALELGIQLRDRLPGSTLTAVCVGASDSDEVLRRAFAFTANGGARAWSADWADLDGLALAHVLGRTIRALGGADLVLCGRQAADLEEGLVGPALAEELGVACVTLGLGIESRGSTILVDREVDGLLETVEGALPIVVTVTSSERSVPRMLKIKDVMLAKRKPIRVFGHEELDLDPERIQAGVRLARLYVPTTSDTCDMLKGVNGVEQAAELTSRLAALNLV
jgi:electron transfer flavoprotein beta subunit